MQQRSATFAPEPWSLSAKPPSTTWTRPDYSITVNKALVGFVELKAPGKGANPLRFRDPHDKAQWERLSSLPNLIYSDGNSFSLWQDGKLTGSVLTLQGDIETSGAKLAPPPGLLLLFESFLRWRHSTAQRSRTGTHHRPPLPPAAR